MKESRARRSLPFRISAWALVAAALAALVRYGPSLSLVAILLLFGGTETKELQRVESPDQVAEAVLIQTTPSLSIEPIGLHVYIARTSTKHLQGKPVLEGTELKDLKISWLDPRVLQVSYSSGCIGSFRNSWLAMEKNGYPYLQDGRPYSVEIRLKPPSDGAPHTCE